ncbi:hypothetical protein ES708_17335 [subsurface metagenome]
MKAIKHSQSLSYVVVITGKHGRVIKRIEAQSRSFVEQWNKLVNVQAKQTASTITDTEGTARSISPDQAAFELMAGAGLTTYGIRIGKGSTAVAIDDYALETPIAHGVGANQLDHLAMIKTPPSVVGSTCSFTIKRNMINKSGATVSGVRELGAYMRLNTSYYGLGFRDVLGSSCDVPDGGAVTVEYTIKVTV